MQSAPEFRFTLGGFFALVLWSTTFALARSLSEQIGAISAGAAVYLLAGGLLVLRAALTSGPSPWGRWRELGFPYLYGCGVLFLIYTVAIYLAVGLAKGREQLLEIALVNYLWPALTVVLSVPLLGRRGSWRLVPATGLALAGVFLVMTHGGDFSWGLFWSRIEAGPLAYGLAIVAAVSWALYSNLARRWAGKGSGVELFLLGSGLALLACRLVVPEQGAWTARALVEVVVLALCTGLGYLLWDIAMRRGNQLAVVTASYFTPLLSTMVSCAYLGVLPDSRLWLGCGLLIAGSIASWQAIRD